MEVKCLRLGALSFGLDFSLAQTWEHVPLWFSARIILNMGSCSLFESFST